MIGLTPKQWAMIGGGALCLAVVVAGAGRVWPVRPRRGVISPFGVSRAGGTRRHAGADLGALPGDVIVAIADGVVLRRVSGFGIFGESPPPGYQPLSAVSIRHADAEYIYAEIRVDPTIVPGRRVRAGERIGVAARNGDGNSMLHLEAWARGTSPAGFVPWVVGEPNPKGLLDVGKRIEGIA